LLELLSARKLLPKFQTALDCFCLIEDETLRAESLKLIQELRAARLAVDYSFTPAKADKQFKRAQESSATNTVKLERNANGGITAKVRNLKTREEKLVEPTAVASHLRASSVS